MGGEQNGASESWHDEYTSPLSHAGKEEAIGAPLHVRNPIGPEQQMESEGMRKEEKRKSIK